MVVDLEGTRNENDCAGEDHEQFYSSVLSILPFLQKAETNSVALVRERTIPSERRLSAKLLPTFEDRGVLRDQRGGSPRPYSRISRLESLLFLPSSFSVVLTRLSGTRSRPTTSQKIW
jgi:hypothetical protein